MRVDARAPAAGRDEASDHASEASTRIRTSRPAEPPPLLGGAGAAPRAPAQPYGVVGAGVGVEPEIDADVNALLGAEGSVLVVALAVAHVVAGADAGAVVAVLCAAVVAVFVAVVLAGLVTEVLRAGLGARETGPTCAVIGRAGRAAGGPGLTGGSGAATSGGGVAGAVGTTIPAPAAYVASSPSTSARYALDWLYVRTARVCPLAVRRLPPAAQR
jgi:hypothetical protein